ncbi:hypothetical protein ALC57_03322 [Trachymyrmex cornetzi]|uniref:Uncharacterized protein n=1 Tax=Trachymyrmex cornetzi TaxID=471704 RepID=A0A195EFN9_9HYME|nr:hypothetical protein ALC57_03322 [Trachymyrmex cornetzi]
MARYRTWDLPMNNEILSCAGNRDTSENARGNKSAATAAKGLLFRFCRGNAERGAFRRGDGLKHAHRAGKRVPLTSRKREDPVGLNRRRERCGSFNIWTCSGFVVLYSSSMWWSSTGESSLLMSTWWSLFCCVSSSRRDTPMQAFAELLAVVTRAAIVVVINQSLTLPDSRIAIHAEYLACANKIRSTHARFRTEESIKRDGRTNYSRLGSLVKG